MLTTKKKFKKNLKKKHVCTNVHVQLINYTLIYCDVFHQCSSMMQEKPRRTIILHLPSLPCTHICQLRNHHQYCSDSSIVWKILYRRTAGDTDYVANTYSPTQTTDTCVQRYPKYYYYSTQCPLGSMGGIASSALTWRLCCTH